MAGGFAHIIMKKSVEKKFTNKQDKMDDIIVFDEDLPKNCTFSFVDFAPILKICKTEGVRSVEYSELIQFANRWLKKTDRWHVISCETVPSIIEVVVSDRGVIESKQILSTYSIKDDPIDNAAGYKYSMSNKMSQSRVPVQFRVQLLRLWIKRFDERVRPIVPQLQYNDFIPKRIKDNEFENIDSVVERVNQSIRNQEINGKILSVQTLACSADEDWSINEDTTQAKSWIGKFVYVLRVFYILGPIHEEELGLIDFVPECLSGGGLFKRPKFESQLDLLKRSTNWLSENSGINLCNTSSIDIKYKSNNKQMSITRETGDYIRLLRIFYNKPKEVSPHIPSINLESKVLVLHKSYADIKKTLAEFMTRNEWTAQQQNKWILLNCETVSILSSNGQKSSLETNSDQSFQAITSSKLSINRNLFFAIKLYYESPPIE